MSAIRSGHAIFLPGGGGIARALDAILPAAFPCGGFVAVAGTSRHVGEIQ